MCSARLPGGQVLGPVVLKRASKRGALYLFRTGRQAVSAYLEGHTQQVQVKEVDGSSFLTSNTRANSIGVHQGGAASSLLYMLYANDLSPCVERNIAVVQYADGAKVLVGDK